MAHNLTMQSLGGSYTANMTQPQIRPAGLTTEFNDSAAAALKWESERPPTPDHLKKYRQSTLHEPGKIYKHYGAAEDKVPDGPFGVHTRPTPGVDVANQMKQYPDSDMGRWTLERKEDIYASSKREPLGQGYVRGHKLPEGLGTDRPFGMSVGALEKEHAGQAGKVVFPVEEPPNADDAGPTHDLYVRSHGAYAPGEQRHRGYDWDKTGVDPTTHRFGALDKDDYRNGVKKALQPGLDDTLQQPATVNSKLHEDYKLANTDRLGKPRLLGTGERNLAPDHTFGMPSLRHGPEPGVAEIIHASYPADQQQPDADLGKSIKEGWRNLSINDDRTFGTPSIRTDLAKPKTRSVANTTNFGNEPDAFALLRPPKSVERGVHEEHYMALRAKDEVRQLVKEAEIDLSEEQFESVFAMAAQADGEEGSGRCCLDTFFRARHHQLSQTFQL